MRKKLLQNTLFAAMSAWALYLAHAQPEPAMAATVSVSYLAQR